MVSPGIPDDVHQLLKRRIESVRQLDLLMLLQTHGARDWSASELEKELRSSAMAIDADLAGLLRADLAEAVAGPPTLWRYRSGRHDETVRSLARCYQSHRTTIIRIIASSGSGSLDQFADAFRLRGRNEPHG